MKPVTNQPGTGKRPIDLLAPEARKALRSSRRAYRRTAPVRGRIGSTEDRLKDWERRVVAKGSSARRWKSLLEEGLGILADAGGIQLEVRQEEQRALEQLRAALREIERLAEESGHETADRACRLLSKCERIRACELEWLDATLARTHAILNLPPSAAPDQVLARLEERRKVATRIDTRRRDAEKLERRAIGVLTGATIPVDGTEQGETSMARRRKSSPAPVEEFAEPAEEDFEADEAGPTLLAPLDDLGGELRRVADSIESMRAEVEGRIAGFVEDLEVSHARALEEEERRRTEIEERLDDLREERKSFEERVIAAEKAAEDVRAAMKSLEEETRKERDRLASERSAMHARVLQSEQERDEALVLVATLTRRLKTPGIDQALNGEEKAVEEKEPEKEEE